MPRTATITADYLSLPAGSIRPGDNDRTYFPLDKLQELAESIEAHGLAQPPLVRPVADGYEIVCGERRFRAMFEILGWTEIPVRCVDMADEQASAIMLAENTARDDLDPVSEGIAYRKRVKDFGLMVDEVAQWAGVPVGRVRNRILCVDRLCDAALQDYRAGVLTHQHAIDLCRIDKGNQKVFLEKIREETFTANQWADLISRVKQAQNEDAQTGLFDDGFALRVEEFAAEVRSKTASSKSYRRDLIGRMAAALDSVDPALAREARDFLASTY